ncbi:cytochrome P450 [Apiospora arundinis]
MEDHRFDNTFLIKEGSTILMPAQVQHIDHDFWGDNVDTFNYRRFLRDSSGGGRSQSVNPFAFRALALLVLWFDVIPTNGKWAAPNTHNTPAASAMLVPEWDFEVALHPRDGGHKDWKVSFSGHEQVMEISAEDIEDTTSHLGD